MEILRKDKNHLLDAIHKRHLIDGGVPQIQFQYMAIPSGDIIALGSTEDESNTQGFLKYLDLIGIVVGEESYTEIVEIFELMHPWHDIIRSVDEFRQAHLGLGVKKRKLSRVTEYTDIIRSPLFQVVGGERQIKFWASGRWGDLNEWIISENNGEKKQIKCKVLEASFFVTVMYQ